MQEFYMRKALELAEQAAAEGEVPVGCVIVHNETVVGIGRNHRELFKNALAHAELEAIDMACKNLGGWRLQDCDLYVTLEPCPMCAGAIINARIRTVYFGAADEKAGACGSKITLFQIPFNHKPNLVGGVLQEQCAQVLADFFAQLRVKRKEERRLKRENTSKLHYMKLNPIPFAQIADGEKTIELRLNDPKRQEIRVNDSIQFTNVDNGKKLTAKVTALYHADSFAQLFAEIPTERCGLPQNADAACMDAYYSREKQKKYGALGIALQVLPHEA